MNGRGTLTWDGNTYYGEFENGMRHGKGKQSRADGSTFYGKFSENKFMDGECKVTWGSQKIYIGDCKNGMANGRGTKTFKRSKTLVGSFKDGKASGEIVMTKADGTEYKGNFIDDEPEG